MSADPVSFQHTYEIAILGNDMALAARPASVVQLVHALYECGYELVVPLSWGEELLAQHTLEILAREVPQSGPRILSVCPKVRRRLSHSSRELAPHVLNTVAPPVATARFLRALQPDAAIRIAYFGACEGAKDPSIDRRVLPSDLLTHLEKLDVSIAEQPTVFESIIPPDRRRHWSVPGGAPALEALRNTSSGWIFRELSGPGIVEELAESILANECSLIDLAPGLGCHCSGGLSGRDAVTGMEPPRAALPVVSSDAVVALELGMESVKVRVRADSTRAPNDGESATVREPRRYAVTPSSVVEHFAHGGPHVAECDSAPGTAEQSVSADDQRPVGNEVWTVARAATHTRDRRRRTPRHVTAFASILSDPAVHESPGGLHPVPAPERPQPQLLSEPPAAPSPVVEVPRAALEVAHIVAHESAELATDATDVPRATGRVMPPLATEVAPIEASLPPTEQPQPVGAEDITWGPPELFTISRPVNKQPRAPHEPRRVPGPGPSRTMRLWIQLLFVLLIAASTILVFVVLRQLGD